MKLERFRPESHMIDLALVLEARDCPIPDSVPLNGYSVYDGETPVAFCFLRMVEGGYGQIDGMATNPTCLLEKRRSAMDLVMEACIKKAKELNLKGLITYTIANSTIKSGTKYGFEKLPHTMFALNLKV